MVWAFLLAACALLCLELGESVHCNYCLMNDPETGCLTGDQGCFTDVGELCMTIQIMHEEKEKFRIQGCSRHFRRGCDFVKEFNNGHTLKISCCKGNQCNK